MLIAGLIVQLALAVEPIHQTLTVPYDVWDVTAEDLNNDDQLDVIALYSERDDAQDRKGIYIFLANMDGRYPEEPSIDFPLDASTGNVFVSRRDGLPEIVVLTEAGLTRYTCTDNELLETGQCVMRSLLPLHTREPIFLRNLTFDLDGDGSDEWIVPVIGGFEIWGNDEKRTFLRNNMDSEAESRDGLSISHRIPRVHVFEHKGHENKAVGLVGRRGVTFHYGEDWKEKRGYRLDDRLGNFWETRSVLEDINGDGYPDLMVTDTKGTADIEVRVQVFLANDELEYVGKPSFEVTSTGGFLVPRLVDLNGDEKIDLVMLTFPITLRNIANYLFRKKVTMRLDTRLFEDGTIPVKETFSNSISMDVSRDQEESVHIYGDFNADGINELAAGTNMSTLTISAITKSGALTKKPWATVEVHSFGVARTKDLDNSGTDDLMIIHPRGTYKHDIDIIRF